MPHILVRDLPDDVHTELRERAQRAGQSLQRYLSHELTRLARTRTLEDVLADIEQYEGGRVGFDVAVSDLDAERAKR